MRYRCRSLGERDGQIHSLRENQQQALVLCWTGGGHACMFVCQRTTEHRESRRLEFDIFHGASGKSQLVQQPMSCPALSLVLHIQDALPCPPQLPVKEPSEAINQLLKYFTRRTMPAEQLGTYQVLEVP